MGLRRYQPRHAAIEGSATVTVLESRNEEHEEVLMDPAEITDGYDSMFGHAQTA